MAAVGDVLVLQDTMWALRDPSVPELPFVALYRRSRVQALLERFPKVRSCALCTVSVCAVQLCAG